MAKIQLKRSVILDGTSAKEPTSSQMNFGEIAINYNKDDPSIFIKDSDNAIIRIAGVNAIGNRPTDIQGYPDILDGQGATLDNRYLKLGSGIGAQVVQSSSATDFNGGLKVSGGSTYLLELANSGATKLVVLPTGQVGIGVTTPTAPLQVNGQVVAGSFVGTGTAITTLDAGNISQGIINTARLPATYTLAQQITIGATGSLGNLVLYADKNIGLTASGTGSYITLTGNNGVGSYRFTKAGQTTIAGFLDFESLTSDRTFSYPNASGTIALTTSTVDNADKLDGQHGVYYTNYTDTAITNVVDSAPSTLNTLNKLAASLNDDANFSTTVTNSLATKLPLAGGTMTGNINMNGSDLSAAGNVGIGTDNPLDPLHIAESGGSSIRLQDSSGNDGINSALIVADGTTALKLQASAGTTAKAITFFRSNTEEAMQIDSSGRVGIGTSSPNAGLHVLGAGQTTANITDAGSRNAFLKVSDSGSVAGSGGGILFANIQGDNANSVGFAAIKGFLTNGSSNTTGDLAFSTRNAVGDTALSERLRITSGGSVGIGTGSPQATLHVKSDSIGIPAVGVAGTMQVGDGNAFGLMLGVNGSGVGYIQPQRNDGATTTYDLLLNPNGGNVGIGTSNASEKLEVYGNARFKATDGSHGIELYPDVGGLGYQRILSFNRTSSAYENLSFGANDFIVTSGATSESLRITSAGRVGIGTSSPSNTLHVNSGTVNTVALFQSTDAGANITLTDSTGSSSIETTGTQLKIGVDPSNAVAGSNLRLQVDGSTKLLIDDAGNVGIGTTSPADELHINSSSKNVNLRLTRDTDTGVRISGTDSTTPAFIFETIASGTATERARIDSSGRLLVGTSTSNDIFQESQLQIEGNTSAKASLSLHQNQSAVDGPQLILGKSRGSGSVGASDILGDIVFAGNDGTDVNSRGAIIRAKIDGTPGSNDLPTHLAFMTTADSASSPTERLRIDSSGRVGIGTTAPSSKLHVKNTSANDGLRITSSTTGQGYVLFGDTADSNTGSIVYEHANDAMTFDVNNSERLRIDSSGRLLVGTSFEGHANADNLTLADSGDCGITIRSSTTNTGAIYFADSTSGGEEYDGYIEYSQNSRFMRFATAQTERLRIDSSGNVGIGTTSPSRPLHISNAGAECIEFEPGKSSNVNLSLHFNRSSSVYVGNETRASYHTFFIGSSEKARIDSSGRLLVGTSSAIGNGADNRDTITAVATAGGGLLFGRNDTTTSDGHNLGKIEFWGNGGNGTYTQCANIIAEADGAHGTGDKPTRLVFSTTASGSASPTERMRIDNVGRANFFSGDNVIGAKTDDAAGTSTRLFFGSHSATGTVVGGTISFTVFSNGNVENTNNSYGAISDAKLKENIVDANSQWDDLKALQVRNYNFIEGQTHTQLGLVAQEVELVSPGLVSESPDRDEDDNDLGTVTKSVNYSVLYMKAVKALQEAMERIETLEQRLSDAGIA